MHRVWIVIVVWPIMFGSTWAQDAGRRQDGFYSGQSNSQSSGQSDGRVDGRANKNEGAQPSSGDAVKQAPPIGKAGPTDAEAMDAIVRPNAPR
jgi:hypothetical protein